MNESLIARGHEAASLRAWQDAFALLAEADRTRRLRGEDEALFADVAYAAGHLGVALEIWERVYVRSAGAKRSAEAANAATRVAMHLLFDTALMAPVRGWIRHAERYLDDSEETAVHARLAVVRTYERLLSGDFPTARRWARRAIEVGSRCDAGAAAIGRIAEARNLILDGEVARGLEQLNDAAMTTVTGELDPFSTGVVYCEVVCALQALAQYDLADEWTRAMEHWRHGHAIGSVHGRCRVHRAEILRLRGSIHEAEREALQACTELRPYLRRELGWPLTELGQIRLILGDLDAAENAFLEAHRSGWDAQPGLARVYLARGNVKLAHRSIRDALENPVIVPSKELLPNSDLREAPLLEAQVEIAVAAGDLERAQWAARRLARVAAKFGSRPYLASSALAQGRVLLATGDAETARENLQTAVQEWSDVGAPYEVARARLVLAQAFRRCGKEERAQLEIQSARSSFEQLGARLDADRAARALPGPADHQEVVRTSAETPTANSERNDLPSDSNEFRYEGDYWSLTYRNKTIRIRDLKGIRYLGHLLRHPARQFYALDLVALENGLVHGREDRPEPGLFLTDDADAGPVLDARAQREYRRRLGEIDDDIEEARSLGDVERETQAEAERDLLVRELSKAAGLGGRSRPLHSAAERARVSVTRALRLAVKRIREHNSELGAHFECTIQTGKYCAYMPEPSASVTWDVCRS